MWKYPSCLCKILAFAPPQKKKLGPSKKNNIKSMGEIDITQQNITGAYQAGQY